MTARNRLGVGGARQRQRQRGAAVVEFALVSSAFLMLLMGAIEVGRVMWLFNAAGEATRVGARLAAVCSTADKAKMEARMKNGIGLADTSAFTATVTYLPAGCTDSTCTTVTATMAGTIATFIPFTSFAPTLPAFTTTVSRESMSSLNNSVCSATP